MTLALRAALPAAVFGGKLPKPYVETHAIGVVWLLVAAATVVIELTGIFHRRSEASHRDRGSQFVIRLTVIPGAILLVLSPRIAPGAEIRSPLAAAIAGIVVFSAGEALRIWARLTLGRYFTYVVMTSMDQPVIQNGPYRFVRHPSYTGIVLIELGVGLIYGNWLGLILFTAFATTGVIYRIFVEEKALIEELGERYRSYAATHKRLIPFVW
jgi:protein-S-isoprenylcysteine O-methyltransferase Ste14